MQTSAGTNNRMLHLRKLERARRMATDEETVKRGQSIFGTHAWKEQKKLNLARIARKQQATHERAVARREAAKAEPKVETKAQVARRERIERARKAKTQRQAKYRRTHPFAIQA